MAYRRIHSEIASSPSVSDCTKDAHLAWPHLSYVADSWGRGPAIPRWIVNEMFKLRYDFTEAEIAVWLDEWERTGMIVRYTVARREYFQILNFDYYQPDTVRHRRKAKGSRYPAPPEHLVTSAKNPGEAPAHFASEFGEDGIEGVVRHPDFATKSGEVRAGFADQRTENREQRTEQQRDRGSEGQSAGSADAAQPPSPRPRVSDLSPAVVQDAEQYLGRTLGEADCRQLVQFVFVEQYDPAWLPRAYDTALLREPPVRALRFVSKILARWKAEGGPDAARPPRQGAPPPAVPPPGPPPPIVAELVAAGVDGPTARQLATQHSEQEIRDQIVWLPMRGEKESPTGFLISAIRKGMAPPPEVIAERRAEENRAADRKRMEERRRQSDAEQQRAEAIAAYRAGLSSEEAEALKAEAEARVSRMSVPIDPKMKRALVEAAIRGIVAERLGLPKVEAAA